MSLSAPTLIVAAPAVIVNPVIRATDKIKINAFDNVFLMCIISPPFSESIILAIGFLPKIGIITSFINKKMAKG
jgi:hypothetical protein